MPELIQRYNDDSNASLEIWLNLLSLNVRRENITDFSEGWMSYELILRTNDKELDRVTGTIHDVDLRALEAQFNAMATKNPRKTEMSYAPIETDFGMLIFTSKLHQDHVYVTCNIDHGNVIQGIRDGSTISVRILIDKDICKKFAEDLKRSRIELTNDIKFSTSQEMKIT